MSPLQTIMSVREMIDLAFGDPDVNIVNHKLIQTILYLIARQLRFLERRVEVEIGYANKPPGTSLSVTEIKLHAVQEKKNKIGKIKDGSIKGGVQEQERTASIEETEPSKAAQDSLSTNKTLSSKSTTERSSTDKTSSDQKSVKHSSGHSSSTDKSSSGKTERSSFSKNILEKIRQNMEIIEETREKELRIIHQRADSKEVQEESPMPMASIASVEYEKLLVVERLSTDEAKEGIEKEHGRRHRLSVVTQDEFAKLAHIVQQLQIRFAPIAPPGFPENVQFLQDLRKGASLTDAMAALQLSARLEAAEKTLKNMLGLITELATQTGIDLSEIPEGIYNFFGVPIDGARGADSGLEKAGIRKPVPKSTPPHKELSPQLTSSEKSSEISILETQTQLDDLTAAVDEKTEKRDTVTHLEMKNAIQTMYDEIMNTVTSITSRSKENADNAYRTASRIEGRLEASLNLGNKMETLEVLVSNYATQINVLDTSLSSQMTNYQEQLTQMQHDLESGIETMAEVLANSGGDTTAVAELNSHFTSLQFDFDNMAEQQKELKNMQTTFSHDLEALWKQIEHLKATKSDRDEVADALRDKAGIEALNGLVSLQQFDAVRGDYEKRIGAAYNKFNNQEIVWQKAIDDVLRDLNEKADLIQLLTLKEDITRNLDILSSRIHTMMDIVGEPRAAGVTRKLHRDAACISCSTAAHMDLEEPCLVPALPALQASRGPKIDLQASKPKEDGDHGICYPGRPIPHNIDPRAHVCNRYCGGSHTAVKNSLTRAPVGMIIRPAGRQLSTGIGSDGKTYVMEEQPAKPCHACNLSNLKTPQPSKTENALQPVAIGNDSDMIPSEFRYVSEMITLQADNRSVSTTPPPHLENLD